LVSNMCCSIDDIFVTLLNLNILSLDLKSLSLTYFLKLSSKKWVKESGF